MIDEDLQEQIDFWNKKIYPILDFNETFTKWLEFCVDHKVDRSLNQELLAPDTSFSIKEDPAEHNKLDTGRCFSVIYDPASELKEEFSSFALDFVGVKNKTNLKTSSYIFHTCFLLRLF